MGAAPAPAPKEKSADEEYNKFLAQPPANVTVLYPRYNDLTFLPHADREIVKAEVRRCLGALQQVHGDAERENGAADDEHAAELGVNYLMGAAPAPAPRENSADDEYDEFLAQPPANVTVNPLMWWQGSHMRLPLLQQLTRKYLGIPATSVPSERVFSTAGNIVTAKRNCLLPETVDMLISEGTGKLEGDYHLELVDTVKPVPVHSPCGVPVALREKLEAELDRLTESEIIALVDGPTPWMLSLCGEAEWITESLLRAKESE